RTSLGDTAPTSFTGTLTSPKLIAPLQMGRGTATSLRLGSRFSQPLEDRVAQRALLGPLGELDLADEDGLDEVEERPARRVREGGLIACQGREPGAQLLQHLVGEARAHVAGVAQLTVLVIPDEQCSDPSRAVAAALGPPADHQPLVLLVLDLQPVARASPRLVGAVDA